MGGKEHPAKGDLKKTKAQLVSENEALRNRVRELERNENRESLMRSDLQGESEQGEGVVAQLKAIMNSIPQSIFVKNKEGRFIFVNESYSKLVDVPVAEIIGLTELDTNFGNEGQQTKFAVSDRQVLDSGERLNLPDTKVTGIDGIERTWHVYKTPLLDPAQSVIGIVGIAEDITEHRRAQEDLQTSQRLLQTVFDAIPHQIVVKNTGSRYVMVNSAWAHQNRMDPAKAIGLKTTELPIGTAAEMEALIDTDRKVMASGQLHSFPPYTITRRDGTVRYEISAKVPLRDKNNEIIGVVGVVEDVTERRQAEEALRKSEERLRSIMDHSPSAITLIDMEGKYILVNRVFAERRGHSPDEMAGKYAYDVFPEESADRLAEQNRTVLAQGRPVEWEHDIIFKDGSQHTISATKFPVLDNEGRIVALGTIATDITGRKETEQSLRQSQVLMRTVFDTVPAGITVRDSEGRYIMVNSTMAARYGLSPEEVVGHTPGELGLPPELDQEFKQNNLEVFESGRTIVSPEEFVKLPNEEGGWRQVIRAPLNDEQGEIIGVVGVGIDVTERKRAEEALLSSQTLLKIVFDTLPVVVAVKDLEGRYITVNNEWRKIFSNTGEDIIGRTGRDVLNWSEEQLEKLSHEDQTVIQSGKPVILSEQRVWNKDGEEIFFHTRKSPLPSATGNIAGIVAVGMEITERKRAEEELRESEERFRSVLYHSPSSIVLKDRQSRYTLVNRVFAELHDRPEEEIVGMTTRELLPDDAVENIEALDRAVMNTGEITQWELEIIVPDGTRRTVINTNFPVRDGEERIMGVGTISTDVTEQRELEQNLRQSQKMEAVGQLAGGIAHEFNNMLQVIINGTLLVRENIHDPQMAKKYLGITLKSAERSAELTKQLLAYSRNTPLQPAAVDLNESINDLTKLIGPIVGADIEMKFSLAGNLFPVNADNGMIKQTLINLCINARDAMPDGGQLIFETRNHHADQEYCDINRWKQPGDYAMISVSDNGAGMSAEVREHIFEPFFTTKDVGQGTGLGMAMVHGIVQQHEGEIEIFSELGVGSTIRIYLPRADSQDAVSGDPTVHHSSRGHETILVAEDEEDVLSLLRAALESKGYLVLTAKNGEEAVSVFNANTNRINLVLLDMIMPKMRGRVVFEQIRQSGSEVPVLFSSGYSLDSSDEEFVAGDGVHTIQKPYTADEINAAVREILDEQ